MKPGALQSHSKRGHGHLHTVSALKVRVRPATVADALRVPGLRSGAGVSVVPLHFGSRTCAERGFGSDVRGPPVATVDNQPLQGQRSSEVAAGGPAPIQVGAVGTAHVSARDPGVAALSHPASTVAGNVGHHPGP